MYKCNKRGLFLIKNTFKKNVKKRESCCRVYIYILHKKLSKKMLKRIKKDIYFSKSNSLPTQTQF